MHAVAQNDGTLSQSVAYQIDYAHSGDATFGGNGPTFPPSDTWSVTLDGQASYPVIADGRVFVTTSNLTTGQSWLYALDETTGGTLWGPVAITGLNLWSGIAYDHGTLFPMDSGSPQNDAGTLTAIDPATGTLKWTSYLIGQDIGFNAPPTAVNGVVYVGDAGNGGTLYAVDENTGNVLWTAIVNGGFASSPAVSSDGVFVSYPCQVYKFDPLSGLPLWHYNGACSGGGGSTPVYVNNQLYVRGVDGLIFNGSPSAIFNAGNGVQTGTFTATTIPAFSAQTGFFLNDGTLSAIDQDTQATLWTFQGDGQLVLAPIVIDGAVVVGSASGTVYALDATSGSVLWSASAGDSILASGEGNFEPVVGLGAGEGWLVVPADNVLTAWKLTP